MRQTIAIALALLCGAAWGSGPYMPWDRVGIDTNADLNVAVPVPTQPDAVNYRIWQDGWLRWGWIEAEPSGDWRQWDSDAGWRYGRIEIEK